MLEWLKRHAWKACSRLKRLTGSNPVLSATKEGRMTKVIRFLYAGIPLRACCHKDILHTKTEASASAFLCCKGRPGKGYRDVERSAATEQIQKRTRCRSASDEIRKVRSAVGCANAVSKSRKERDAGGRISHYHSTAYSIYVSH